MILSPFKFHDQFQDVLSNFYSLINVKFYLQGHVPRGNIIGPFGLSPLNKQLSSTSKMHTSFMKIPNDVKFVTKLNRNERPTTLVKKKISFGAHSKSFLRWEKGSFDFVLRKFSIMFDFSNLHLKINHDPSFKCKSVKHESCFP